MMGVGGGGGWSAAMVLCGLVGYYAYYAYCYTHSYTHACDPLLHLRPHYMHTAGPTSFVSRHRE